MREGSDISFLTEEFLPNSQSSQCSISSDSWVSSSKPSNVFTALLINARLLKNKLSSLEENIKELAADVSLITKMWFSNDVKIKTDLEDFTDRTGFGFIRQDRLTDRRGGGLAICYDQTRIQLSRVKVPPSKHEILAAIGRRTGQRRKTLIVAVYIPPWYNAQQNRSLFNYTNDLLTHFKNKYENPMILFGGDFNRRSVKEATREHGNMKIIQTGPTRNDATLDILSSNFNELLLDSGTTE